MTRLITVLLFTACSFAAAADDMYIGPYEARAEFDSISADKVARIRAQRILFGSRSWGGAVAGAYAGALGAEYTLNWQNVSLAASDTMPHNIFASPGLVHFRQPDEIAGRWDTFGDIIRGRNGFKEYGREIDIAFQFLYSGVDYMWRDYSALFDSLRQEYPDVEFGICTHHVSSKGSTDVGWNIYGRHYSDSVLAKYRGVVPIIDLSMIAAIGAGGDTATFQYQGRTYPQLHSDWATPDQIHLTDYTTMCKAFYMMLDYLTPDTGAYDTAAIAIDSGMINVYVDPSASGAGNGTDWDNAYTSLEAAELLQRRDLVAADAKITFHCRGGIDHGSGVTFDVTNWTVDSTHFITVDVAEGDRHDGTRGTGYVIDGARYSIGLYIKAPYTVINGVAIDGSGNGRNGMLIAAKNVTIKNCLIYDTSEGSYKGVSFGSGCNDGRFVNNLIYNCRNGALSISYSQRIAVYNNTILNCGRALSFSNHASYPLYFTNNYFGAAGSIDTLIVAGVSPDGLVSTSNFSTTGEFGSTVSAMATDAGAHFANVTPGQESARITYDSDLYSVATDLGADPVFPFSYDAAGTFRNNGAYSVGAYEVVPVSGLNTLPPAGTRPAPRMRQALYSLGGRPALPARTGIYLQYDAEAGTVRKVMILK